MAGVSPIGQPAPNVSASESTADVAVSGNSAAALAALVSEGDVVSATIIGSNGAGQDIIELLGQRLVASLPPNLVPGDQVLLQIVSVDGTNIVTRNLGPADENQPASVAVPPERGIPPPLAASDAVASDASAPAVPAAPATPPGPPAAPPSAVFVAASVTQASAQEPLAPAGQPAAATVGSATPPATTPVEPDPASAQAPASANRTSAPVQTPQAADPAAAATGQRTAGSIYRAPSGSLPQPNAALGSLEARIAAARAEATSPGVAAQPAPPSGAPAARSQAPSQAQPPVQPAAGQPTSAAAPKGAVPPADTQAIINRLTISHRDLGAPAQRAPNAPAPPAAGSSFTKPPPVPQVPSGTTPNAPPAQSPPAAAPATRSPLAFGAPPATPLRPPVTQRLETTSNAPLVSPNELAGAKGASAPAAPAAPPPSPAQALLEELNVPQTATTRAAAELVANDSVALPQTLRALDASLAGAGEDPRVLAARTIASFVAELDPAKPTLAAQLSAFVDHVATGPEPKLATLLNAQSAADAERAATPNAPAAPNAPPAAANAQANPVQLPLPIPGLADAQAAERGAALEHNLKNLLLSLVAAPPSDGGSAGGAIQSALSHITASQLQTLQSMQVNPGAIAFSIPLPWPTGGQNAELQIWKDAPENTGTLTSDNFHIAFVLNTAHLGTVAVDLQSVGRGVKVAVKTEEGNAASSFRGALTQLSDRLEMLKYRVVSLDAGVAPLERIKTPAAPVPVEAEEDPNVTVDLRI